MTQKKKRPRRPVIEKPEAQKAYCSAYSHELLEEVRTFWQPHAERDLSLEDAREIVDNLTDFFVLLDEWDRNSR